MTTGAVLLAIGGSLFALNILVTAFGPTGPRGLPRRILDRAAGLSLGAFALYCSGTLLYWTVEGLLVSRSVREALYALFILVLVGLLLLVVFSDFIPTKKKP